MHLLQFLLFTILLGTLVGPSYCSDIFKFVTKTLDVQQGRSVILQCTLKDKFASSYKLSWIMDGKSAINSRRNMTNVEGQLKIYEADKNLDAGKFQCLATSITDSSDKEYSEVANLNIKWLDIENVERLSPATIEEIVPGKRVVLKCNATGRPRPQLKDIQWKRQSTVLPTNGSFTFKAMKLIIDNVTLNDFDGEYSCCHLAICSRSNYYLKVRDEHTPVLVQAPENRIVALNGLAVFTCIFDLVPVNKRIRWYHGERLLRQKLGDTCKICDYGNGTLVIRGVREKYEGRYSCKATGNNKVSTVGRATLGLAHISMKNNSTKKEFLDPGQSHEQHCGPVDAEPDASIMWYKDGKPIVEDEGGSPTGLTVSGKTLVIMSVEQSDEGKYKCVASNVAGNVSKIYDFRIKRKPKIKSNLIRRIEKEGRQVTLNCEADGVPEPKYIWYRNETVVSDPDQPEPSKPGKFVIDKITPVDSGIYKCVAVNEMGQDSSSAMIGVEERLKIVEPHPHDVCLEVNKTDSVVCSAKGVGDVRVDWETKSESTKFRVIESSPSNKTLKILASFKSGDHWVAKCVARDSESQVDPVIAKIEVSVGKKPKIYKPPLGVAVFEGQSVRFDCGVYPEIELKKLYWTIRSKNSTSRQFTIKDNSDSFKYTIMNNGSFNIKNSSVEDSGAYTCHYKACGFYVNESAELTVAERDLPPAIGGGDTESTLDGTTPRYQKVQTIALAVGGAIAYLGITIVIIVYCRRKRHYKMGKTVNSSDEEAIMMNGTCRPLNTAPVRHLPEKISALQYDHSRLEYVAEIGRGNFGEVLLSKAPGLLPDVGDDVLVMVKKLAPSICVSPDGSGATVDEPSKMYRDDSQPSQEKENLSSQDSARLGFNREINLLFTASHENISRLLGVCNEYSKSITAPDCLITEYLEWGILKLCLHASHEGKIHRFSKHSKMKICCQVAAALEHLSSHGLCHLDVATRNCLISSKHIVKLSILSLSKDGFEKEYYNHNGQLRPIRWMPPEILLHDEIHAKSDVWSYGVTCWEIFSLGKTPYSDLSDEEFVQEMGSATPPTLPTIDGSKRIASLITKCCQQDPTNRPEFYQIVKKLQSVISGEARSKTSEENTVDIHRPLLPHDDIHTESNTAS